MRPQQIMFMGLLFTTGILLSLALGGSWLGDEDVSIANSLGLRFLHRRIRNRPVGDVLRLCSRCYLRTVYDSDLCCIG
jgi:hypothetical protein